MKGKLKKKKKKRKLLKLTEREKIDFKLPRTHRNIRPLRNQPYCALENSQWRNPFTVLRKKNFNLIIHIQLRYHLRLGGKVTLCY